MKIKKRKKLEVSLLLGVLVLLMLFPVATAASYGRSNSPQYSPPMSSADYLSKQGIGLNPDWDDGKCEAGQDFLLQISPTGCEPSIIPSDLLEEQNTAVFCPIMATQINPLMKVESIKDLKFTFEGNKPDAISGVGFHPARAAINPSRSTILNSPILDNVGYAVIVLKKQKNESAMPEWVEGNLSVEIRYDIKNAFGIGKNVYYLPEIDNEQWTGEYNTYGFLENKFYLRAESIGDNNARIGIYTDENTRLSSVNLEKGKTSDIIYLPGYYCKAGVKLKLETLDNPGTRARLKIGNDVFDVVKGQSFLENRCKVMDISDKSVVVQCTGDDKKSGKMYLSRISSETVLDGDCKSYYENATQTYLSVAESYPGEPEGGNYFGLRALQNARNLANDLKKEDDKKTFEDLIKQIYPDEKSVSPKVIDSQIVEINGESKTLSLLGVYESKLEDYSVDISIGNEIKQIGKDEKPVVMGDFHVRLKSLTSEFATIEIKKIESNSYSQLNIKEKEIKQFEKQDVFISQIHLTKIAKVSVTPEIKYAKTDSTIHFKIAIEKRWIQLTPEKVKELIQTLNKTIEKWQDISDGLGKVVKVMKTACLATGAVLTVKNLFSSFNGETISRQYTMRGLDGSGGVVNKFCRSEEGKKFGTLSECLSSKEAEKLIEETQSINEKIIQEQNAQLESIRKQCLYPDPSDSLGGLLSGDRVNNTCFCDKQVELMKGDFESLQDIDCDRCAPKLLRALDYNNKTREYSGKNIVFNTVEEDVSTSLTKITETCAKVEVDAEDSVDFELGTINTDDLKVSYFNRAPDKNVPAIVPLPQGHKDGWYVGVRYAVTGAVQESGALKLFWLCNVGKDNTINFNPNTGDTGRDYCASFIGNLGVPDKHVLPKKGGGFLNEQETRKLFVEGRDAYYVASSKYKEGAKSINVQGVDMQVDTEVDIPQTQCEEFMEYDDCKILYNVCDPVVCPSSRCNFGGAYHLDNVIQSGILGSTFACLPNFIGFGGSVIIPVCLSGIYAGIEGLLSVFKSYRDCLEYKLETGEMVGFCDEIYSIQMCDFFWKQAAPFANLIIPKLLEAATGQFVNGGGEYMNIAAAWENAEKSTTFFTQHYAVNAFSMFKAKSITEVGSEMCRNFLSVSYPDGTNFLDVLTQPTAPPQFHAWVDSAPHTDVTVSTTHQYSVFYHIYAGTEKDEVAYAVYLKHPDGRTVAVRDAKGKISKGAYETQKKDFTWEEGFNEVCVIVDTQEECGFGRVSTSFALDYVQDKYVEEQTNEANIDSAKKCISGSSSAYEFVNPNVQAGAEGYLNPNLRGLGITRVCSTGNPGGNTNKDRWQDVGYCDDPSLRCWLDTQSVRDASSLKNITEKGLETGLEKLQKDFENYFFKTEEYKKEIEKLEKLIGVNCLGTPDNLKKAIQMINDIEKGENGQKQVFHDSQKAELLFLKARAYDCLTRKTCKPLTTGSGDSVKKEGDGEIKQGTEDEEKPPVIEGELSIEEKQAKCETQPDSGACSNDDDCYWKGEGSSDDESEIIKSCNVCPSTSDDLDYAEDECGKVCSECDIDCKWDENDCVEVETTECETDDCGEDIEGNFVLNLDETKIIMEKYNVKLEEIMDHSFMGDKRALIKIDSLDYEIIKGEPISIENGKITIKLINVDLSNKEITISWVDNMQTYTYEIKSIVLKQLGENLNLYVEHTCNQVRYELLSEVKYWFDKSKLSGSFSGENKIFEAEDLESRKKYYAKVYCLDENSIEKGEDKSNIYEWNPTYLSSAP